MGDEGGGGGGGYAELTLGKGRQRRQLLKASKRELF